VSKKAKGIKRLFRAYLDKLDKKSRAKLAKLPAGDFATDKFYTPKVTMDKLKTKAIDYGGAGAAGTGGYIIGGKDDPNKKDTSGRPDKRLNRKISAYKAAGLISEKEAESLRKSTTNVINRRLDGMKPTTDQRAKIERSLGFKDGQAARQSREYDEKYAKTNRDVDEAKKAANRERRQAQRKYSEIAEQRRRDASIAGNTSRSTLTESQKRNIKRQTRAKLPAELNDKIERVGVQGLRGADKLAYNSAYRVQEDRFVKRLSSGSKGRLTQERSKRKTFVDEREKKYVGEGLERAEARKLANIDYNSRSRKNPVPKKVRGKKSKFESVKETLTEEAKKGNKKAQDELKKYNENPPTTTGGMQQRLDNIKGNTGEGLEITPTGTSTGRLQGQTKESQQAAKKSIEVEKGSQEDVKIKPLSKVIGEMPELQGERGEAYVSAREAIGSAYRSGKITAAQAKARNKKALANLRSPKTTVADLTRKTQRRSKKIDQPGSKPQFDPSAKVEGGKYGLKKNEKGQKVVDKRPAQEITPTAKDRAKLDQAIAVSSNIKKTTKADSQAEQQQEAARNKILADKDRRDKKKKKNNELASKITQTFFEEKKEKRKSKRLAAGAAAGTLTGAEIARRYVMHDVPARHRQYDKAGYSKKQPTTGGVEGQDLTGWAKGKKGLYSKDAPTGFRRKVTGRALARLLTGTGLGIAAGGLYHHAKQKRRD